MSIRVSWNTVKVKLSGNAKKHGGPNGIVVQANDLQKQMGFFQDYGLGQATSKRGCFQCQGKTLHSPNFGGMQLGSCPGEVSHPIFSTA